MHIHIHTCIAFLDPGAVAEDGIPVAAGSRKGPLRCRDYPLFDPPVCLGIELSSTPAPPPKDLTPQRLERRSGSEGDRFDAVVPMSLLLYRT